MKAKILTVLIGTAIFTSNVLAGADDSFLQYDLIGAKVVLDKLESEVNSKPIKVVTAKAGVSISGNYDCIKFKDASSPNRLIYVCAPNTKAFSAVTSAYAEIVGVVSSGQSAPLEEVGMKVFPIAAATLDCSASSLMCAMDISSTHTTRTPCYPWPSPLGNLLCYHSGFEGLNKHRCYKY